VGKISSVSRNKSKEQHKKDRLVVSLLNLYMLDERRVSEYDDDFIQMVIHISFSQYQLSKTVASKTGLQKKI